MSNVAFIFSGQGAQYVGMGKDLYENFQEAKAVFEKANASLPFDLIDLCFNGPDTQLNLTAYTQPAILTTSIAALSVIDKYNIKAGILAGLSLGEYSALVAAGVLNLEDAAKIVHARGTYMQEAVPQGKGAMSAIIGLSKDKIFEICKKSSSFGIVEPANFNYPGQIVIGGEVLAVKQAGLLAKDLGAKRVIPLTVSGPFHTSMLKDAATNLNKLLVNQQFNNFSIPVVSNTTANIYSSKEDIVPLLTKQVMSSVMWEQSIERMIDKGIEHFIELGPGKVLSTFVRKISKKANVYNVEDTKSLEKTLSKLGG